MLCISAVYAGMRCPSVCPFVGLSVTFVSSVKMNKHIFDFLPWGSQAILVFHTKRGGAIPTGTPYRGRRMHGCMKNDDFRPISRSISDLSRSAVAKRPRDASCLIVSFSSTKRRAESSYVTNNHIKTESFRYISTAYFTTIVSHVLQILQETKKTV